VLDGWLGGEAHGDSAEVAAFRGVGRDSSG
jgi:hypothetical protein